MLRQLCVEAMALRPGQVVAGLLCPGEKGPLLCVEINQRSLHPI